MKRELTCIVCPLGCPLVVELDGKEVVSVSGNTCPRGEKYAEAECTNPVRTITTTMRCENGEVVPVKTNTPIPKEKMFDCMKEINRTALKTPIKRGDVLIDNIAETGADIIATGELQ